MNTFGNTFRLTTFGESHGTAVGGVIDGCPAGIAIDNDFVDKELLRRRLGDIPSDNLTLRHEPDRVEWLSGIFDGRTLGTPIAYAIRNSDCRSDDYEQLHDFFRPGHADYTYQAKYGLRDHRGGGRASGRETAARVVAGAVAKMVLHPSGIDFSTGIDGRNICCTITGLPAGVGNPIFDRLNARLAYAMHSIPSAMMFAMGETADAYRLDKNLFPDVWNPGGNGSTLTATNHCGGIQGGISNGMPVVFHVGFHPPATNPDGMVCRDMQGTLRNIAPHGRHDTDHLTRLPVIVESMAALTIADLLSTNQ